MNQLYKVGLTGWENKMLQEMLSGLDQPCEELCFLSDGAFPLLGWDSCCVRSSQSSSSRAGIFGWTWSLNKHLYLFKSVSSQRSGCECNYMINTQGVTVYSHFKWVVSAVASCQLLKTQLRQWCFFLQSIMTFTLRLKAEKLTFWPFVFQGIVSWRWTDRASSERPTHRS